MDGEWSKYHWNLKRRKKLGKIQSGGRGTEKQSDRSGEKEEKRSGGLDLTDNRQASRAL